MSVSDNEVRTLFRRRSVFSAVLAVGGWLVSATGCSPYGTACLRNSDCASGEICVNGSCQSELGVDASDAAIVDTAIGSRDMSVAPQVDASVLPTARDASFDAEVGAPDMSVDESTLDALPTNDVDTGAASVSVDVSDARLDADARDAQDARDATDATDVKLDTTSTEDADLDAD